MSASPPIDVARLRAALACLSGRGVGSADSGRVFDALHGNLSPGERRVVVDELALNSDAAEAWRLARELAPEPAAAAASTGGETWRWMSAAAALLVVGLGWQFFNLRGAPEPPAFRSVEQRTITSSLPPAAALSRAQPVLRWTALDGAHYRVRVLTPELELLDETGGLTRPEHTLRPDVLRRIPAGGRILWQVEGRSSESTVVISPTFSVQVE